MTRVNEQDNNSVEKKGLYLEKDKEKEEMKNMNFEFEGPPCVCVHSL